MFYSILNKLSISKAYWPSNAKIQEESNLFNLFKFQNQNC